MLQQKFQWHIEEMIDSGSRAMMQHLVITRFVAYHLKGGFQLLDLIVTELKRSVKNPRSLIGRYFICQKNPLQDLLSSLNAVISTNERH